MRTIEFKQHWERGEMRKKAISKFRLHQILQCAFLSGGHIQNLTCDSVHQRYFLLINQNKLLLQLRVIALIPASPIGQSLSLLTPIINFLLHAP